MGILARFSAVRHISGVSRDITHDITDKSGGDHNFEFSHPSGHGCPSIRLPQGKQQDNADINQSQMESLFPNFFHIINILQDLLISTFCKSQKIAANVHLLVTGLFFYHTDVLSDLLITFNYLHLSALSAYKQMFMAIHCRPDPMTSTRLMNLLDQPRNPAFPGCGKHWRCPAAIQDPRDIW